LNKSWSCVSCTKKSKNIIFAAGNSIQPLTPLSTTESDLKLIIIHLDNLRAEQTKLIDLVNKQNEKLNFFDNKLHEIFSQLSSIKNGNIVLRNDLTAVKDRVDLLESAALKSNDNHDMNLSTVKIVLKILSYLMCMNNLATIIPLILIQ
jgi:predicted nuclease with TOPRIM domain